MEIFLSLAAFITTLGVIIIAHEFGHFLLARKLGIYVECFSIGFGKTLWRTVDKYGTEFVIALIPLGGYVKLLNDEPNSSNILSKSKKRHIAFNDKNVYQRAAVILAGPLANFLLAIFAYWLVFIIGISAVRPIIDDVRPKSIAEQVNILPNMEIKSVNGIEIDDWNTARLALLSKIGDKNLIIEVLLPGNGNILPIKKVINLKQSSLALDLYYQDPIIALGIMPISVKQDSVIVNIKKGSAAALSGLKIGDRILKVGDKFLDNWHPLTDFIRKSPNLPLLLTIDRHGQEYQLTLIPEKIIVKNKPIGLAGIELPLIPLAEKYKITHKYGILRALYKSNSKIWYLIKFTLQMIIKLFWGDIRLNSISGPIYIAKVAGFSVKSGIVYYLMFIALISINLGIINLFPLPILDGGHLLFLLLEKIKGAPVSEVFKTLSYRIGAIILIILMGLAFVNDLSRL